MQRFQTRGITKEISDMAILTQMTSRNRLILDWFTFFIRQIVRCSLAALKTAPISPPKHPIMMKRDSSQMAKLELSPLMLLNSPKENSFSILACPHMLSRFFTANMVPRVTMAQKKASK